MFESLQLRCAAGALASLMALSSGQANAVMLHGKVTTLEVGRPMAQVGVTLSMPEGAGASAITVFTDDKGRFAFPKDLAVVPFGSKVSIHKLGYELARPSAGAVAVTVTDRSAERKLDLQIAPVDNAAATLPASYWMSKVPESPAKHLTTLECSGCHQFPSAKVLRFARQIEAVRGAPDGDAKAREEWRKLVRQEGWRASIKYMRAKTYDIYPEGSLVNVENIPWPVVQGETFTLFNAEMENVITQFLVDNFPTVTEKADPADYSMGAPVTVTPKTVIREYELPRDSLVREAIMVPKSPYIWGADLAKSRLLRLDPKSGDKKWYPVPYDGSTGPHTIVGSKDGDVWMSMMDNDQLGRFDPRTEQWKLWKLKPDNLDEKKVFGGQATVHDISYDSNGELATDDKGRIWLTMIGLNMMGSVDPKSGYVAFYDTVPVGDIAPIAISLYSTLLSADGKCAWFSQLVGYFGCFNTETLKVETDSLVPYKNGEGPRRLARDTRDIVWVPLYGAGQVMKYDGRARKVLATYDLPDRRSAPYAVTWDERRKALWVATTNADVIYRFDPKREKFSVIPMPRKQAYFRQLGIDPATGNLIGSYGNIPAGSGPSMAVVIEPGD